MHYLKWSFLFVFMFFGNCYAMTDKEIREDFAKTTMICSKDYSIEMTDLLQLQQLVVPTKTEVKCLLACSYRKYGSLNSKGLYDVEVGYKLAELVKNGSTSADEERFSNAKKLVDICKKVNDEPVSDGDKGCDRAALIFKCVSENAPKLGFKVI